MEPTSTIARSYTIWFSQRTGSTWFAGMLEECGAAGMPREHLNFSDAQSAYTHYEASTSVALLERVRSAGTGGNGVFGIKHSFHQPAFDDLLEALVPAWRQVFGHHGRLAAWEHAFPAHRHIFVTRRNKVRLAVSWWRAIQTGEWHRRYGSAGPETNLRDAYDFAAIDRLVNEATLREAGIAEMFAEAGVVPLTLTYEDIVSLPATAFSQALHHLELQPVPLPAPHLAPIADAVSERWTQLYREQKQRTWSHRGW